MKLMRPRTPAHRHKQMQVTGFRPPSSHARTPQYSLQMQLAMQQRQIEIRSPVAANTGVVKRRDDTQISLVMPVDLKRKANRI